MSCKDCEARRKMAREALLSAHIGTAAKQVAIAAAELAGLKEKTGAEELEQSTESSWPFRRAKTKKPARARQAQNTQDETNLPAPPEQTPITGQEI